MFDIMKNSRLYKFLRKIAGDDVSITPVNVLEDCLNDIADAVEGGGSSDSVTLYTYPGDASYADIKEDIDAGKNVAIRYINNIYWLDYVSETFYMFKYIGPDNNQEVLYVRSNGISSGGSNMFPVLRITGLLEMLFASTESGSLVQLSAEILGGTANYNTVTNFIRTITGSYGGLCLYPTIEFKSNATTRQGIASLLSYVKEEDVVAEVPVEDRRVIFAFAPYILIFNQHVTAGNELTSTYYFTYENIFA